MTFSLPDLSIKTEHWAIALARLAASILLIAALSYIQIDDDFFSRKWSQDSDHVGSFETHFFLDKPAGPLFLKFKYYLHAAAGPEDFIQLWINERLVKQFDKKSANSASKGFFQVPDGYVKSGRNHIAFVTGLGDRITFKKISLQNYLGTNPNPPAAFIVGKEWESAVPSAAALFATVLLSYAFAWIVLRIFGFLGFERHKTLPQWSLLPVVFPAVTLAYTGLTQGRIIFPVETLFWFIVPTILLPNAFLIAKTCLQNPQIKNKILSSISDDPAPRTRFFLITMMSAPILFLFYAVLSYAVNVPLADDFAALNDSIFFQKTTILGEILTRLVAQHNEHRILLSRLFHALPALTGVKLNFKVECLLGFGIYLIALYLVIGRRNPEQRRFNLYFALPAVYFATPLVYWENLTWGIAGLTNLSVYTSAILAFLYFSQERPGFAAQLPAFAFATLAFYTLASGVLVFVVILCYLVLTKNKTLFGFWLVVFLAVCAAYFSSYHKNPSHPDVWQDITLFSQLVSFFFTLLGNSLALGNQDFAFLFGVFLFTFLIYLTLGNRFLAHRFHYTLLLFLQLSALLIAVTRSGFGINSALTSRYSIISCLTVAVTHLLAVRLLSSGDPRRLNRFVGYSLLVSIVVNVGWLGDGLKSLEQRNRFATESAKNWLLSNGSLVFPDAGAANLWLRESLLAETYELPLDDLKLRDQDYSQPIAGSCESKEPFADEEAGLNVVELPFHKSQRTLIRIDGFLRKRDAEPKDEKISSQSKSKKPDLPPPVYVVLRSAGKTVLFSSRAGNPKFSVPALAGENSVGFVTVIPRELLAGGEYEVGVCREGRTWFGGAKLKVGDKGRLGA